MNLSWKHIASLFLVLSLWASGQTVAPFSDATASHAVCWNVSGITLDGNTTSSDITYQWYVSSASAGSGFSKHTGTGAQSSSLGITSNSVTRYYRRSRVFTSGSTTDSAISIITLHALPTISGTLSVCEGLTRTLTGSGVSGTWSSGDTDILTISSTGVVTGVGDGTTTITYTDGNYCSVTVNFTVNSLPSVSAGADQSVCTGETVSLSATYNSATTSISWNNSVQNNVAFAPSSTTTYTVVGVDGNGCIATDEVEVTLFLLPIISGGSSVCVDATITLTGSGTPAASNAWVSSNSTKASVSSNGVVTGLQSGSTTITYTDENGCEQTHDVTINGLPAVNAGTDYSVCEGIQISLSGGGASSYSWDNSVTNGVLFTPTSTTTYTVTGTNSNNCANTDQITVTVNPAPNISGATVVCEGETVSLTSDITGGTWDSDNDGIATVNSSGVVSGVGAGTASISYTLSTGCEDTYSVTVYAKPVISGTLTGISNGSDVTLSATGTAAASNPWTSSNTAIATVSSTGVVSPLSVGTSDITFTNSNGCSSLETFTVSAAPSITSTTTEVCIGGSISLTATPSGGTWTTTNGTGTGSIGSTGSFTGSSAGSVDVIYSIGGTSATTTITVNAKPVYSTSAPTTLCVGNDIALSATPAGGTWSIISGSSSASLSGSTLTGSSAGTTVVRYTDGNGCVVDQSITVNGLPTVSAGSDQSICSGESVTLTANGATTLSWNNGIGSTNPATVSPTSSTTYEVTGTDGNGCVNTDQVIITVNAVPSISGATAVCAGETITLSTDITGGTWDSDNDGIATVSASGIITGVSDGTAIISYTLSTGCEDTYSVTVYAKPVISGTLTGISNGSDVTLSATGTAAASNPWTSSNTAIATVSSTGVVSPLSVGTSDITFTNSNGCSSLETFTVSAAPSITSTTTEVCIGGSISLTATPSGGTWTTTNGTGTGSIGSTGSFTGSSAGSVDVIYSIGGTSATTTITVNAKPVYSTSAPTTLCVGNDIALSATPAGGTWSIISGSSSASLSGSTLTGSSAGTTVVRYTDGNGCVVDQSITVNGLPTVSAGSDQSICSGESVTLTANGATTLSWNNGIGSTNPATVSPTSSTTYEVTGTDGNGCVNTDQVIITVNAVPSISGATAVCSGETITLSTDITGGTWDSDDDGIATVSASGIVTGVRDRKSVV